MFELKKLADQIRSPVPVLADALSYCPIPFDMRLGKKVHFTGECLPIWRSPTPPNP